MLSSKRAKNPNSEIERFHFLAYLTAAALASVLERTQITLASCWSAGGDAKAD